MIEPTTTTDKSQDVERASLYVGTRGKNHVTVRLELRHRDGDGRSGLKPEAGPEFSATYEERDPFGRMEACGAGVPEALRGLTDYAPGWSPEAWHLNHMRADCVHQRAAGWSGRKLPNSSRAAVTRFAPGQGMDPHPAGLIGAACPTCGYRYGTAWLAEPIPPDVLAYLREVMSAPGLPVRIAERVPGLTMTARDAGAAGEGWTREHRRWACTFRLEGHSATFSFYTAQGEPSLRKVLECLLDEAAIAENGEGKELGLSPAQIKALNENRDRLKAFLGDAYQGTVFPEVSA